jgi:hypothetical protein
MVDLDFFLDVYSAGMLLSLLFMVVVVVHGCRCCTWLSLSFTFYREEEEVEHFLSENIALR